MTSQPEFKTNVRVNRYLTAGASVNGVYLHLPEGQWNQGEEVEVIVRHLPAPVPPRLKRGWWVSWWGPDAWRW